MSLEGFIFIVGGGWWVGGREGEREREREGVGMGNFGEEGGFRWVVGCWESEMGGKSR